MNSEEIESELTLWDKQFTEDVKSGRFFWLTNKWIIDFEKGNFKNFWNCYEKLQNDIKILTDKTFSDLKKTREHSSLKVLKVGRYWSLPIGEKTRALGVEVDKMAYCGAGYDLFHITKDYLETINNEERP